MASWWARLLLCLLAEGVLLSQQDCWLMGNILERFRKAESPAQSCTVNRNEAVANTEFRACTTPVPNGRCEADWREHVLNHISFCRLNITPAIWLYLPSRNPLISPYITQRPAPVKIIKGPINPEDRGPFSANCPPNPQLFGPGMFQPGRKTALQASIYPIATPSGEGETPHA